MKRFVLDTWLIFVFSFGQVLVPVPVLAHAKGTVNCSVEWGSSNQTFSYVFSGVVSCQGRPCPNAKVQLQLSTASQPDVVQDTVAAADGSYELKIAVAGTAQDSAQWKLIAQAPESISQEAVEVEGSSILTDDENTIVVQRPLQIVQG